MSAPRWSAHRQAPSPSPAASECMLLCCWAGLRRVKGGVSRHALPVGACLARERARMGPCWGRNGHLGAKDRAVLRGVGPRGPRLRTICFLCVVPHITTACCRDGTASRPTQCNLGTPLCLGTDGAWHWVVPGRGLGLQLLVQRGHAHHAHRTWLSSSRQPPDQQLACGAPGALPTTAACPRVARRICGLAELGQ